MSGIVGYIGKKNAIPILISGLKNLEYRGYETTGIAYIDKSNIICYRSAGTIDALNNFLQKSNKQVRQGIAYTRWNSESIPENDEKYCNIDKNGSFALTCTGLIDNRKKLEQFLVSNGVQLKIRTNSQLLVNIVDVIINRKNISPEEALKEALLKIEGAISTIFISKDHPDIMIAAHMGNPIVIGVEYGNYYISSDISAISNFTENFIYLNNGEMAVVDQTVEIKKIIKNANGT